MRYARETLSRSAAGRPPCLTHPLEQPGPSLPTRPAPPRSPPSRTFPRATRGGAGAASGCQPAAGRAGPSGDGAAVGGGLEPAAHRPTPPLPPGHLRQVLKRFTLEGPAGFRHRRPGPPKDAARRQQVTTALDRLLGQARTWTAAQVAEAVQSEGIALSARQSVLREPPAPPPEPASSKDRRSSTAACESRPERIGAALAVRLQPPETMRPTFSGE